MNIDLLPFSAHPLDSSAAPEPFAGEPETLTLELALRTRRVRDLQMGGIAKPGRSTSAALSVERAAVLPADASPLTITF